MSCDLLVTEVNSGNKMVGRSHQLLFAAPRFLVLHFAVFNIFLVSLSPAYHNILDETPR